MTSTPRVWTRKWDSLQNQLISPCSISDLFSFIESASKPDSIDRLHKFSALWDTGATHSVISKRVVDTLGIKHEGFIPIAHANGIDEVLIYHVGLVLPSGIAFPMPNAAQTELTGIDVLIGMDITNRGDFAVTNRNGKTMFSYRFPSMTDIDFQSELE
jgi:predicted aspartyl protease